MGIMTEIKGVFDIVKNIQSSSELLSKEVVEEFTNPYIMNRAMTFNTDTLFFSDEASMFQNVPSYAHYLFYFYSIEKKKYRPGRWEKKTDPSENLDAIKEAYNVSTERALEYLDILTEEQIEEIKTKQSKGGMIGKKPRKSNSK